jgi:hypothetical protein
MPIVVDICPKTHTSVHFLSLHGAWTGAAHDGGWLWPIALTPPNCTLMQQNLSY